MMKAAMQNKEFEVGRQLNEAETAKVFTTLVTQRKEAAEQYHKAGRDDLARKEFSVIEGYLPQAVSEEEIAHTLNAVIQELGATTPKDTGPVMKAVMAKLAGKSADGKRVNELVRARLQ